MGRCASGKSRNNRAFAKIVSPIETFYATLPQLRKGGSTKGTGICPACGASIRQTYSGVSPAPFQGIAIPSEIQLEKLLKRLTRLTYLTAFAAALLLVTILIIYFVP